MRFNKFILSHTGIVLEVLLLNFISFPCAADTNLCGIGARLLPTNNVSYFADGSALPSNPSGGQASDPTPITSVDFLGMLKGSPEYTPSVADTMGAVGTNHVVTISNAGVLFRTRAGLPLATNTLPELFGVSDVLSNYNIGDPRILYDLYAHRWIATAQTTGITNPRVFVAVSTTANPLLSNGWYRQTIVADTNDLFRPDQPTVGFNKHWIVEYGDKSTVRPLVFLGFQ